MFRLRFSQQNQSIDSTVMYGKSPFLMGKSTINHHFSVVFCMFTSTTLWTGDDFADRVPRGDQEQLFRRFRGFRRATASLGVAVAQRSRRGGVGTKIPRQHRTSYNYILVYVYLFDIM